MTPQSMDEFHAIAEFDVTDQTRKVAPRQASMPTSRNHCQPRLGVSTSDQHGEICSAKRSRRRLSNADNGSSVNYWV